ncbi:hypothetical protein [Burkholderia gladioli]|uniref:hypothetical protein n=1 Tax=Burkholderia gladioli TaxID=28095 RepID=UPI00163E5AFF|nr:hypothetical protein [Burkholderia gladioli]MBJ9658933.1 hypothetical protein [Burkholderia gladioli]
MSDLKVLKVKAKVNSVNGRHELNGDDHRLACDVGIEFNQSNRFLDKLDTTLVETFYWRNPASDDVRQDNVEGVERFTDFPNLRPVMENVAFPIKWLTKFEESLFVVHDRDDPSKDIRLADVKVNEIRFTPKEGGTVLVGLRIQGHPDEVDLARLFMVLQSEVSITVDTDPDDDEVDPPAASAAVEKPARAKGGRRGGKGAQTDAFADAAQQIADGANAE